MTRAQIQRATAIVTLGAAFVAVVYVLLFSGSAYIVHARYIDAGQLVKGDLVEVSGRRIGTVTDITLTDSNQADIRLKITDGDYKPLHRGTIAGIRTVGLSGVANRFVDLHPGPQSAPEIEDGGVLATFETRPIVDLDILLDALDPPTRKRLQGVIRDGAKIYGGAAEDANRAIEYLNPAITQARLLAEEVVRDQRAFELLISSAADVSTALASRRDDLVQGIGNTATTMSAIAAERVALQDILSRAPAVLRGSISTLANVRATLADVRPALLEARPVAPRLARVLRNIVPTSRQTRPVLANLRRQLPALQRTLEALPGLEKVAVPAVNSLTTAVGALVPIVHGLRPYTPDVAAGLLNGLGGNTAGYYDANGHYARIAAHFGAGTTSGITNLLPGLNTDALSARTGIHSRCPGGAAEPAADKSNPYVEDPSTCNPEHNHP